MQQELHRRGVVFGANLNNQELQQLLNLSREHEAMREQLQSAELAACPEGLGCAVCMENFCHTSMTVTVLRAICCVATPHAPSV